MPGRMPARNNPEEHFLFYYRYYAAGFVSMAEATEIGVVEAYERLAREVLDRPESIPSAIHNLLLKLAETHPGRSTGSSGSSTRILRLYVSDTGASGIADSMSRA